MECSHKTVKIREAENSGVKLIPELEDLIDRGLTHNIRGWTPEEIEQVKYYKDRVTVASLARALNKKYDSVYRLIKKLES